MLPSFQGENSVAKSVSVPSQSLFWGLMEAQ